MADHTVLVVGGTGRTGGRVVSQLLDRGVAVRAVVRSAKRLPEGADESANLTAIEADLLSLSDEEMAQHTAGCTAIISCLGHNLNFKGMYGQPRYLVTEAARRLSRAAEKGRPQRPVRYVLMSSVSVNDPGKRGETRSALDRFVVWFLRGVLPPARDNQRASDTLWGAYGTGSEYVEWVAVRPDTLLDGDVTRYDVHENLVATLFKSDETNMANVAHFMCELATDDDTWAKWRGKLPVIVNAPE